MIVSNNLLSLKVLSPRAQAGRIQHRTLLKEVRPSSCRGAVCVSSSTQLPCGVLAASALAARNLIMRHRLLSLIAIIYTLFMKLLHPLSVYSVQLVLSDT